MISKMAVSRTGFDSRDNKGRSTLAKLPESFLDLLLCLGVYGAGRLVEQDNRRSLQDGPRNRNTLKFTSREFDAPLPHACLVACRMLASGCIYPQIGAHTVRKAKNLLVDAGSFASFKDFLICSIKLGIAHIVHHRIVEENW